MKTGVYSILSDISNNKYDFIIDGSLSFGTVLNKCECGLMCRKCFLITSLHICLKLKMASVHQGLLFQWIRYTVEVSYWRPLLQQPIA